MTSPGRSRRKILVFSTVAIVLSVVGSLFVAEAAAQLWVHLVARKAKLFRPDSRLGWAVRSNLDVTRLNADGRPWRIVTGDAGLRGPASWSEDARVRLLVLGDSFAFGEGVDIGDRFDSIMAAEHPDWSLVNLGVMGFGTDQQVVFARDYAEGLRAGDLVVLLTCGNDFVDILRRTHSGRAKPWFSVDHGRLIEHRPRIGWWQHLRDRSYVAALAMRLFDSKLTITQETVRQGAELYRVIVDDFYASVKRRGVSLLLAHHGEWMYRDVDLAPIYAGLCGGPAISCLNLDEWIGRKGENDHFLRDGHWSVEGHRRVADALSRHLLSLDSETPGPHSGGTSPREDRVPR